MKSFGKFAIALALIVGVSAQAIFDPNWERPVLEAKLTKLTGNIYPVAQNLTKHRRDGEKEATLFSMREDTGLRCIMAPCPSFVTSLFEITDVEVLNPLTKRYIATELPKVLHNNRIYTGLRTLEVVEHQGFRMQWDVTVENGIGKASRYVGYPQGVITIQSLDE